LDIKNLKDQLLSMQEEMKSDFKKTLTNDELDRLEALTQNIDKYRKDYSNASIERLNIETRKQNLEQEIRTTLYPRRDQLKSRSVDEDDSQLDERMNELESLKKALADILTRQKASESEVEKIAKSMRENQAKLNELKVNIVITVLIVDCTRRDCSSDREKSEDGRAKHGKAYQLAASTG
jgi:structural maintenance of chromosome 3 (chondroitin sulfate proteoglycan 6)